VILVEAGPRILPAFDAKLAARAMRDLESLGVQVWVAAKVTHVGPQGVVVGNEQIAAATVLWGAGVQAADVGRTLGAPLDQLGRVQVNADLSIPGHPEVFVAGDLAHCKGADGKPLPGVALVAMQQGIHVAGLIKNDLAGKPRAPFKYFDMGKLATIGRSRAVCEIFGLKMSGWIAWWVWLLVHIYRLSGFRNRLMVLIQWAWSYMTFGRGARLIVGKEWRAYKAGD
jgi:NADH dehydrogenase